MPRVKIPFYPLVINYTGVPLRREYTFDPLE